jgi:hypothetical protein
MALAAHQHTATDPAAGSFARWAIDAGLRPLRSDPRAFSGTLPSSRAPYSVVSTGTRTTLRAAEPDAGGLQSPVHVWWDAVYLELACGARRIEDSDTACAFMSGDVRTALSDPLLLLEDARADEQSVPLVSWACGQVIVEWRRRHCDPETLAALVAALDAAVVAVRVARLNQLIDLDPHGALPEPARSAADEAVVDGALATVFAAVAALVAGFVLAAGAEPVTALVAAALVLAAGAAIGLQEHAGPDVAGRRTEDDLLAHLYAGRYGMRHEDPGAFQRRFWPLGIPCAPAVVLHGPLPGTRVDGRVLCGTGPGGSITAAVTVPLAPEVITAVSDRAVGVLGASVSGGCLVVAVGADPAFAAPELLDDLTATAARLLS